MSEAPPPIDRDAEMLARLAELDMAAAEHVHAQLIAAAEPDEINSLGRTYQRVSRSLRQTLALKAKLTRERAQVAALNQIRRPNPVIEGFRDDDRAMELQDAVARMAEAATAGDAETREALLDRFDRELDDWTCEAGFADADLDAQVRRACRLLGLPEDLATHWRRLPRPVYDDDPSDTDPADPAEPPVPWSGSG